jgi:uncharacterized membrane-anchored protein
MRFFAGLCFAAACLLAAADISADQGVYPSTDEDLRAAYDALQWHNQAGPYKLSKSHATIQLQVGLLLVLGADAERYSWLGSGVEYPATEAVLIHNSGGTNREVYYDWRDEGYVSDSDWEDVDGDALLAQYRKATEASNEKRSKNGLKPMHVVDWLVAPRYDKATRTVTYAMEMKDDGGSWSNTVALRLGRAGYTEFTWVGSIDRFKEAGGQPDLLNRALATHSFDQGHRYEDFQDGDKVASRGVAGLVAATLGIKSKSQLATDLAKIVIPLIAVVALAAWRFRELFGSFRRRS